VFARGIGVPAGVGTVGQAFVDALTGRIAPRSIGAYGVDYPASYDFAFASDGAATASSYVVNFVESRSSSRVVLGGFPKEPRSSTC
jgi:cutinase